MRNRANPSVIEKFYDEVLIPKYPQIKTECDKNGFFEFSYQEYSRLAEKDVRLKILKTSKEEMPVFCQKNNIYVYTVIRRKSMLFVNADLFFKFPIPEHTVVLHPKNDYYELYTPDNLELLSSEVNIFYRYNSLGMLADFLDVRPDEIKDLCASKTALKEGEYYFETPAGLKKITLPYRSQEYPNEEGEGFDAEIDASWRVVQNDTNISYGCIELKTFGPDKVRNSLGFLITQPFHAKIMCDNIEKRSAKHVPVRVFYGIGIRSKTQDKYYIYELAFDNNILNKPRIIRSTEYIIKP